MPTTRLPGGPKRANLQRAAVLSPDVVQLCLHAFRSFDGSSNSVAQRHCQAPWNDRHREADSAHNTATGLHVQIAALREGDTPALIDERSLRPRDVPEIPLGVAPTETTTPKGLLGIT